MGAGVSAVEPTPEPAPQTPRRRKVRRGPILVVVIAAVVAAVIVQQNVSSERQSTSASASAATVVGDRVSVPPIDVVSSAWYCAEGTSSPDGRADETVIVASLAVTPLVATVTVMPGGDATPVSKTLHLAPGEETRVHVADILATPEPGVLVETVGGRAAVSHQLEHGDDFAVEPCTRSAGTDWYFAVGTTVKGSQHDLALFNPFGDDAIVDVTFLTDTGAQEPDGLQALVVPRRSRITIPVEDSVLRQLRVRDPRPRVSAVSSPSTPRSSTARCPIPARPARGSRCRSGRSPRTRPGGSRPVPPRTAASRRWPSPTSARATRDVEVRVVLVGDQKVAPQAITVPAGGVLAVELTTRVPLGTDYSVTATARTPTVGRVPIVAEMLASWAPTSPTPGVASTMGSPVAARRWVMPQPEVDADAFLTVLQPRTEPVTAAPPAGSSTGRSARASEPEIGGTRQGRGVAGRAPRAIGPVARW